MNPTQNSSTPQQPRGPGLSTRGAFLEQRVEVETPEQVAFSYTVAGIGSRAAAALIDYAICLGLFLAIYIVIALIAGTLQWGFGEDGADRGAGNDWLGWLAAILMLAQFLIIWGYYVLFEGLADGQTPGKRRMGLRVVQDGGYSVTFATSAVRNLLRIIDLQPGFTYGVGMTSALISKSGKRLGDIVAGTIVVQERTHHIPVASAGDSATLDSSTVTAQLSDDEYALLERYIERRRTLEPDRRKVFLDQLSLRFMDRMPPGDEPADGRILSLYQQEKALRARGIAARSDSGAAREHHALVAAGANRWQAFARMLETVAKRGLKNMSEADVAEFVSEYRELSTDLARLRTAARHRDSNSVFYLSRLVARGHNLLYGQKQLKATAILDYFAITVPGEVRRSAGPILISALLLFGPMLAGLIVVARHPETASEFLGAEMIDRAETALVREGRGEGYLPGELAEQRGAMLATHLATNNVQVTYLAFALGITAGIGTALVLVLNGVQLGGGLGIFASHDALHLILAFVAPHGVLELLAICIAGGAGLLIGSAFLLPGNITRREALVVRGRRAITLIAGSTLLLLVAGMIEGYVSPLNLSLPVAYSIAGATAVAAILYFMAGRRRQPAFVADEVSSYKHTPSLDPG